ncbi:MAG: scramblase [Planctomycetes bacterium]|nr:scramblase [Planctomycetota bacterium]
MSGLEAIVGEHERVLIQQTKEWGEILLGFESKNRYELKTELGDRLGLAAEEAQGFGAWFLRNLFGRCRKATIHVYDRDGRQVGRGEKPFRWFFHRMEVYDGERKLGAIQRKWSWLHRRFAIENAAGEEVMEIFSPLFRVWTFKLMFQQQEVGAIRKKWGGLLKEMFTDADTFGLECEPHVPVEVRSILLVATFLIDFTCFENNQGKGGGVLDLLGD